MTKPTPQQQNKIKNPVTNRCNTQYSPQERILRKTTIFEAISRPFTTEPKIRRIRRGHTIVIRRCKEIMKHLWQCGHKIIISRNDLDNAIFYNAGGDYRTLKRYRGFDVYSKGRKLDPPRLLKHIPGYLERLRYIQRFGNGKYRIFHENVPLDYHCEQVVFSTPLGVNMNGNMSKMEMCACEGEKDRMGVTDVVASTTTKKQQTTTHHPHTNLERCVKHGKNEPSHQRRDHNGRWLSEHRSEKGDSLT